MKIIQLNLPRALVLIIFNPFISHPPLVSHVSCFHSRVIAVVFCQNKSEIEKEKQAIQLRVLKFK